MLTAALALFLLSAFVIAYVYALYPLLLVALRMFMHRPAAVAAGATEAPLPRVSILIPAYNEERILARKLDSTLALDYPRDRLCITVVSDRSTDATDRIAADYAARHPELRVLRNEQQKGKIATLSELGAREDCDILVITDCNALFEPDALRRLVAPFRDPRVGLVNGNKVLRRMTSLVGEGEGTYWQYETFLKQVESDLFSNAFITGAMTAIRKELFLPLPGYLEFDHVLPLHVVNRGCRAVFARDARFVEETAATAGGEWKVRVRNAVRGFTMVLRMSRFISVRGHPWYVLHVWSRKVLRWLIGLPALGLLASSLALAGHPLFLAAAAAQAAFYAVAALGWVLERRGARHGLLALPFYFCLVNAASLVGLGRALRGQRVAVWAVHR